MLLSTKISLKYLFFRFKQHLNLRNKRSIYPINNFKTGNKKNTILLFLLLFTSLETFAQKDSTKHKIIFSSVISASNNGIDVTPAFNLGKPDVSFSFSAGNRFTIEPIFRFSIDGRPWKFRFLTRYKIINKEKFRVDVTVTPILNFLKTSVIQNGEKKSMIQSLRYLTFEALPFYSVNANVILGAQIMYSRLFEKDYPELPVNSQTIGINITINNVYFFREFYFMLNPQFYYLRLGNTGRYNDHGFYISSNFKIEKKDFPIAIISTINKSVKTDINETTFLWNVGITWRISEYHIEGSSRL